MKILTLLALAIGVDPSVESLKCFVEAECKKSNAIDFARVDSPDQCHKYCRFKGGGGKKDPGKIFHGWYTFYKSAKLCVRYSQVRALSVNHIQIHLLLFKKYG